MNLSTKIEPEIQDLPLFEDLTPVARAELLAHAVVHGVPAGTILFEQGDLPTFQHIVLDGAVQLFGKAGDRREVLIEVVHPPELVIPAAVVRGAPYLMQARVPRPARVLMIQADAFRAAITHEPALALAMIDSLSGQFRRMVRQIKSLKLWSATERVGSYIRALSRRQGDPHHVVLPYEKNVIASELGMTRESFSRALSALQAHGIAVRGDTILIVDAGRLAAASGSDPSDDAD